MIEEEEKETDIKKRGIEAELNMVHHASTIIYLTGSRFC